MTELVKIFKETALPGTLEANAIYFVAPTGSDADYVECYVTGTDGTVVRHTPTKAEISAMIKSEIGQSNELLIVADIAARDGLSLDEIRLVYVKDATGDTTVNSGGAYYLYDKATTSWIKTGEGESMDVVQRWADIEDKPNSPVTEIDDAVTKRHSHENKTQLDEISEDENGNLTYKDEVVKTYWAKTDW